MSPSCFGSSSDYSELTPSRWKSSCLWCHTWSHLRLYVPEPPKNFLPSWTMWQGARWPCVTEPELKFRCLSFHFMPLYWPAFSDVSSCFIMFHHVSSEVCRSAVANGQTERSASQRKRWAHLFGISNRLELLSAQLVQKRQDCARLTVNYFPRCGCMITYWRCYNRF